MKMFVGKKLQPNPGTTDCDCCLSEVLNRCVRESSRHYGKWLIQDGGNFTGWMSEFEISERYTEPTEAPKGGP